jgi:hypothetical protein
MSVSGYACLNQRRDGCGNGGHPQSLLLHRNAPHATAVPILRQPEKAVHTLRELRIAHPRLRARLPTSASLRRADDPLLRVALRSLE